MDFMKNEEITNLMAICIKEKCSKYMNSILKDEDLILYSDSYCDLHRNIDIKKIYRNGELYILKVSCVSKYKDLYVKKIIEILDKILL